jgi:hypothetical protein
MGYLLEEARRRREGGLEMEGWAQVLQMMTIFESSTRWCMGGCLLFFVLLRRLVSKRQACGRRRRKGARCGFDACGRRRREGARCGFDGGAVWRRNASACSHTCVRENWGWEGGLGAGGNLFAGGF